MELPIKVLEKTAIFTRPKIEEQMLIVIEKTIHEDNLAQPLETNTKQFQTAVFNWF